MRGGTYALFYYFFNVQYLPSKVPSGNLANFLPQPEERPDAEDTRGQEANHQWVGGGEEDEQEHEAGHVGHVVEQLEGEGHGDYLPGGFLEGPGHKEQVGPGHQEAKM